MPDRRNFTLDVSSFTVGAMLRAGVAVRTIVRGAASLEEAAELIVRYLYDHCIDQTTGERSCALARFYKTHQYGGLEPEQVEDAVGSPHIPAQHDFVRRYGIASVVGFGGLLRSGELYVVIPFSRVPIPAASAALFLVLSGRFRMELRDRTIELAEGEMLIVPRGVEHRPVADEECAVMLFEPASTLNTGNVRTEKTLDQLERL